MRRGAPGTARSTTLIAATTPRIGVVGLGAVGVCVARGLRNAGIDLVGFGPGAEGRFEVATRGAMDRIEIQVFPGPSDELRSTFDLIVTCLKNHVFANAIDGYLDLLKPDGVVVCAQNGLMEYLLATKIPEDRVLGALVLGSCAAVTPARVEVYQPTMLRVGPFSAAPSTRALDLIGLFRQPGFSTVVPNILEHKWTKLMFSSVANPLSAIAGVNADVLFRMRRVHPTALRIVEEVLALGTAMGVRPARLGVIDPHWFAERGRVPKPLRHALLAAMSVGLHRVRVSMLQDIEKGRETEIEYLNGWIARESRARGLPAPYNERAVALIHELELGVRSPDPRHLAAFEDLRRTP